MRCIFCMAEKEDTEFTVEHVFPEAIGGTITIRNVCKPCNDYLGRKVDFHLTDNWISQCQRMIYKIPGKTGVVPNPLEKGYLGGDFAEKIQYRFSNDGTPKGVYTLPQVHTEKGERGLSIQMKLDKSDEHKALEIINKILKRNNMSVLSQEELDARMIRQEQYIPNPSVLYTPSVDVVHFQRGIFKIAYELAHDWLGPRYFDDVTAQRLRTLILDDNAWENNDFTRHEVIGNISINTEAPFWRLWDTGEHIAFMQLCGGIIVIAIRIFNCFSGGIVVSNRASDYSNVMPRFIAIDPATKRTRNRTYEEELMTIARRLTGKE